MKILITGATGFIGNHLLKELLKDTKNEIIATSRDIEKAKKHEWFSRVKYISYDLNSQEELNLFEYFDKPDKVIHLAWDGLPNYNDLIHIEKNLFNNYQFIKNLVANGLKDITITGTCFEYGMVNGCLSEDIQTNPSNSYGIAKDSLRRFIEELNKEFVNYLNYGGYPETVFSEKIRENQSQYIKSDIIDKVLLRDLPSLYGINDIQELNRLFTTLAYNTGQEVSLDGLSKDSGVAKNTIKRYLEYLEAAFLIKRVERIDNNCKRFKRANFFKIYSYFLFMIDFELYFHHFFLQNTL